ncbi:MAG: ABC transporter substrate-binding protein, partial [Thermodesulfobacteriota bacterium]
MNKRFFIFKGLILSFLTFSLSFSSPAWAGEMTPVRIAVIPVIDTLPLFVAQAEGLFAKAGLEVKLIPVTSAPERDQMLQAEQADGTLNELLSVMLFNRSAIRMQAVRYGLMATAENPHFF